MNSRIQVTTFQDEFLSEAAALFIANFRKQRQATPLLPDKLEEPEQVINLLKDFLHSTPGIAALRNGRLVGYLSWLPIDRFRNMDRTGAFCPEWGHAVAEDGAASIYLAMYRKAAVQWNTAGCQVYAITLLSADQPAAKFWFWNGFGMIVINAIRSTQPLNISKPKNLVIRAAQPEEAETIARLESEHYIHYSSPPISMVPQPPEDVEGYREFLRRPNCKVWLAWIGNDPVGYVRFEPQAFGAAAIVRSDTTIAISAAYTRPQFRGHGVAPALLEAGLQHYAAKGFNICSVDFESTNPEASHFWLKYFDPVCISVMRILEKGPT